MKRLVFLCAVLMFLSNFRPVFAIVNPLNTPNNHFGIHVVDENDLDDAAKLVNSTGGEWGYITMVMRADDRNKDKWQATFDRMRKLKLIPIIRLATVAEGSAWKKPTVEDAQGWADFLNSLNWVTKNRYIILFNETNHANEWGGEVKPEEYAVIVRAFHDKLKAASDDFFILLGGMDEATPTNNSAMDASEYLRRMVLADGDVFTLVDGLAVHSYPNPNFSGSAYARGKATIRSYEWLTNYLEQFKLNADIPIFITETGWTHKEGSVDGRWLKTTDEVAELFTIAFTKIWTDKRIVAITPFILNYQDAPFDHFSWRMLNSKSFYPHYEAVRSLSKIAGKPVQTVNGVVDVTTIPGRLTTDFLFMLPIKVRNTGQAIWTAEHAMKLHIISPQGSVTDVIIDDLEPMRNKVIKLPLKTPSESQMVTYAFQLFDGEKALGEVVYKQVEIVPPTTMWSKIVRFLRASLPQVSTVFAK